MGVFDCFPRVLLLSLFHTFVVTPLSVGEVIIWILLLLVRGDSTLCRRFFCSLRRPRRFFELAVFARALLALLLLFFLLQLRGGGGMTLVDFDRTYCACVRVRVCVRSCVRVS